jgi:hypothetical protein
MSKNLPVASAIVSEESVVKRTRKTPLESVLSHLEGFTVEQLAEVMRKSLSLIEEQAGQESSGKKKSKKGKSKSKKGKSDSEDDQGPKVKKAVPTQLKMNHAWVKYVKEHALANGWSAFPVHKKNGEEEQKGPSVMHQGAHIFKDSVSEKNPKGVSLNHSEAMSLSKHYKSVQPELYATFQGTYQAEQGSEEEKSDQEPVAVVESAVAPKKKVVKKGVKKSDTEEEN